MRFAGKIISGRGVGRELGFPTLNFELAENWKIEPGVFAARLFFDEKTFPAILFFGNRETFDGKKALEIHVLGEFSESPTAAEFEILDKIREVAKFENSKKLVAQIEKDCAVAREILGVR